MEGSVALLRRKLSCFEIKEVHGLDNPDKKVGGEGSYGAVYEVTVNRQPCYAKQLHSVLIAPDIRPEERQGIHERFLKECLILSELNHDNIVRFVGVNFGSSGEREFDVSLIMEKLDTDLSKYLQDHPNVPLCQKLTILLDVSEGLLYLHSRQPPIIHRDLTTGNILLTTNLQAKIADFGVSRALNISPNRLAAQTKCPGTLAYMPPEALQQQPVYGKALDIFSFGEVCLCTIHQKFAEVFDVIRDPDVHSAIHRGEVEILRRKKWLDDVPTDHCLREVLIICLRDKPDRRPTTQQLYDSLTKICIKKLRAESRDNFSEAIEKDMAELKNSYKKDISELSEQLEHHKEVLGDVETVKTKLDKELQDWREEALQSRQEIQAKTSQVKAYKKQVDQLKESVEVKDQQIDNLTEILKEISAELSDIRKTMPKKKEREKKKSKEGRFTADHSPSYEGVERKLAQAEKLCDDLQTENQVLLNKVESEGRKSLKLEIEQLKFEIEELKDTCEHHRKINQQLREKLRADHVNPPPAGKEEREVSKLQQPLIHSGDDVINDLTSTSLAEPIVQSSKQSHSEADSSPHPMRPLPNQFDNDELKSGHFDQSPNEPGTLGPPSIQCTPYDSDQVLSDGLCRQVDPGNAHSEQPACEAMFNSLSSATLVAPRGVPNSRQPELSNKPYILDSNSAPPTQYRHVQDMHGYRHYSDPQRLCQQGPSPPLPHPHQWYNRENLPHNQQQLLHHNYGHVSFPQGQQQGQQQMAQQNPQGYVQYDQSQRYPHEQGYFPRDGQYKQEVQPFMNMPPRANLESEQHLQGYSSNNFDMPSESSHVPNQHFRDPNRRKDFGIDLQPSSRDTPEVKPVPKPRQLNPQASRIPDTPSPLSDTPSPVQYRPNDTRLQVEHNALLSNIGDEMTEAAAEVMGVTKDEKERAGAPLDPNLVCPMCMKQYRIGEIQLFRVHVNKCDGARH